MHLRLLLACSALLFLGADWAQFRGPSGSAIAPDAKLPLTWSDEKNIAWKVSLPGRGPSSPIVVGERVYVTCSEGARQERLIVLCFDAKSGDKLWERRAWATGRTLTHVSIANAAPTPASDGKRIFALFSSNDLLCFDLDGNLQWFRGLAFDYPKAGNDIGMSSSPIVVGDTVVVQVENFGDSFAAGIDAATGETRWRKDRKAISNWCSPTSAKIGGSEVVLLQSPNVLTAHDPKTGEQLWQYDASCANIPSTIGQGSTLFVPANGLTALDLSGGSAPQVLWESGQLNPGPASPIVRGDKIYTLNRAGVLTCGDAKTGKVTWQLRVGGTHWGTPVLVGQRLYAINDKGEARVIDLSGEKGEIVGESKFDDTIQASPAVANNALFIRSDKRLWKIAE